VVVFAVAGVVVVAAVVVGATVVVAVAIVVVDVSVGGAGDVVSVDDGGLVSTHATTSIATAMHNPTSLIIVAPPFHDPTDDGR
jgi:hypothetical protein